MIAATLLASPPFAYRWFYVSTNLMSDQEVGKISGLLQRASKAGYNGMVLTDYKFESLADPPANYRRNLRAVLDEAKKDHIDVFPVVLPIGYAGGMLAHNPGLIEPMPARDVPFVAKNGMAQVVQDPEVVYRNFGFEDAVNNKFSGFLLQDGPGVGTFIDRSVAHSGQASIRMENPGQLTDSHGNCRVMQKVAIKPWHHYAWSAWVKSEDLERTGNIQMAVLTAAVKPMCFMNVSVKPTQDWAQVRVTFNSQNNTEAFLYMGIWDGAKGKLWWDDVQLEQLGLMNVVQRTGCPLTVRSEDGTLYREGTDYEKVIDPRGGVIPWPGEYETYHESPPIKLTAGSRIREGQPLKVSYYHAAMTDFGKTAICPSDPATQKLERDEIERIRGLIQPKGFFLAHDEIRVMNWCETCQNRRLTPAQLLDDDVNRDLRQIGKTEAFVWSDMFDPFHNVHDDYYLVNGTFADSWKGLPKSVVVVNWNQNNADSLKFFSEHGYRQILAGYYDSSVDSIKDWIGKGKGLKGIDGVMYTTWENRYDDLEAFAKAAWGDSK